MTALLYPLAVMSLLLAGGIFGFFYAWVCSTMWGLDTADPAVAITAMQAMNASVRNAVFAPAFFGTPVALLVTATVAALARRRIAAAAFALAAAVYVGGALLPTILVNVPMNKTLGAIDVAALGDAAAYVWEAYSGRWQVWNGIRTVFSAASLILTGLALIALRDASRQ